MINKTINSEKVLRLKEIALKYSLLDLVKQLDELIERNKNYKLHILMIGGYSAGKSALLNKYIGKNVLQENQGPETSIATELYFSDKERIFANMLDGNKKEISRIEEVNIDEMKNIEYYLYSENIKMQDDYIMVDTPGFDSGIEKHNKALIQYVNQGTAFILVIDCEKGTISESTLNFVNEITNYSTDIAIIINKCDKKIEKEVQEIKEYIEELLTITTGRVFPIICTSIFDVDVDKKIKNLVNDFNSQYLYDKNITSQLNRRREELIQALQLIKENEKCDTSEIEEEIARREEARKKLLDQIDLQKKRLGTRLHNEVKDRIVAKIYSQLMCNVNSLAEAYKGGVELFQERVIQITRPIMVSEVESYSSIAYEDFVKNLNYSDVDTLSNIDKICEVMQSVHEKLIDLKSTSSFFVTDDNNLYKDEGKSLKTYRSLTSILAIATNAIAPQLELLIVFLPDIMKILGVITGNTKEHQLIQSIQNKVIPQIVSKIKVELDKSLNEVEDIMIYNISFNVEEILDIENNALEIALKKKKEARDAYSQFISAIDKDITIING